jgi:hypothetical protein
MVCDLLRHPLITPKYSAAMATRRRLFVSVALQQNALAGARLTTSAPLLHPQKFEEQVR